MHAGVHRSFARSLLKFFSLVTRRFLVGRSSGRFSCIHFFLFDKYRFAIDARAPRAPTAAAAAVKYFTHISRPSRRRRLLVLSIFHNLPKLAEYIPPYVVRATERLRRVRDVEVARKRVSFFVALFLA